MLFYAIIFIYLGADLSAMQYFNENEFLEKEKNAMSHIANYCLDKPKRNFCSEANLESMLSVLKFEREENMRKAEHIKKQRLQFFAKNPQYKFMSEFDSSRF